MVTLHQNDTRIGTIISEMSENFPKWESDQQSRKKKKKGMCGGTKVLYI